MVISNQRHKLAQRAHKGHWEKKWKGNKERWEKTNEYWQHHIHFLKKYIDFHPDTRILDIGCGPGGLINCFGVGERYGLDSLMDYFLENFDMSKEIKWIKGCGENSPFNDNFFDLVISTNTIDHTQDPEKIFAEMRRTLKEQGFLFLTVDTYPWWVKSIKSFLEKIGKGDPRHPHSFLRSEIQDILGEAGFKIREAFDEAGALRGALGNKKREGEGRIPLRPKNKIVRALEIGKKQGFPGLLKEFLGFAFIHIFQDGRFYPKNHSVFIASKQK